MTKHNALHTSDEQNRAASRIELSLDELEAASGGGKNTSAGTQKPYLQVTLHEVFVSGVSL
jgi:hypothetical protein